MATSNGWAGWTARSRSKDIVKPATATERLVYEIWANLFPEQAISCVDDFFVDLGGYSLLAARCVSTFRGEGCGSHVSVLDLYEHPTLREFAVVVDEKLA